MTPVFKNEKLPNIKTKFKNKIDNNLVEEYMNSITKHCLNKMKTNVIKKTVIKKTEKIDDSTLEIPTINNYNYLMMYNFNSKQLKVFSKYYKIKSSGNKSEQLIRLYTYLYFSSFIIKIQKNFRGSLVRKYKRLHGPASMNRKICTNQDDFITMEPIEEINYHQFFSYKDEDEFIYGFDLSSLYNLYLKTKNTDLKQFQNPYNRNTIPISAIKNIKSIIKLSKLLKISINLKYEDDTQKLSFEKTVELRALSLFQNIDSLGNYSNSQWFLSLNRNELIKFTRELYEIWNYRSQITHDTKHNICPLGDPFHHFNMFYIHNETNLFNNKNVVLNLLEKLVNTGIDKDSKTLGAYYVLGALTLVNADAAVSLPWLYQSFCYF
jgi:hypothetical protein